MSFAAPSKRRSSFTFVVRHHSCATDAITVIDSMFQQYVSDPTMQFTPVANSDGQGNMWGVLRANIALPGLLQYLCSINTECGGIIANG